MGKRNHTRGEMEIVAIRPYNQMPNITIEGEPSTIEDRYGFKICLKDQSQKQSFACVYAAPGMSNEEVKANAKLMAGAPHLLDVVEQFLDSMSGTSAEGSIIWIYAKQAYENAAGLPYENFVINNKIDNVNTKN